MKQCRFFSKIDAPALNYTVGGPCVHEAAKKRMEMCYGDHGAEKKSRAVLLLHLQVVLSALVALSVAVVFAYTPMDCKAFYLALTSLTLGVILLGGYLNLSGRYAFALTLTVAAMCVSPWVSIIHERIVHSGDLIPTVYVIIPAQISALFLSAAMMAGLGLVQSVLFLTLVLTDAARDNYNWPSLVCFVLFAAALGSFTSQMISRQHNKAIRMQEALRESERKLTEISVHDALTGLYNRRRMEDVLAALIGKPDARFGVAMLDVDDYKGVNDKYGHACGDDLIREIAGTIVGALAPGECAFRYGGDEFLITLSGADIAAAKARGEAVRETIEATRYVCLDNEWIPITASVGVSFFPVCGADRDAILRDADRALYTAKHSGKNRVVTSGMLQNATWNEVG